MQPARSICSRHSLRCFVNQIMLAVSVGLSFLGARVSRFSVNALDPFVLSQEVPLNQFSSEEYLFNITTRLVISAPIRLNPVIGMRF